MYYSKITILIPCYNVEKYIYKCLNSLVQQNDKNFNLILINDGSTDTTLSIMQEFEKKYSKLMSIQIFSQENVGLVETRKRLVKLCKTKYFVFIDSDDWVDKKFISSFSKKIEKKDYNCIVAKNKIFSFGCYQWRNFVANNFSSKNSFTKFIKKADYGYLWNKLYNTKFYLKNINILEKNEYWPTLTEDHYVNSYLLSNISPSTVSFISSHQYYYRKTKNSISNRPKIEKIDEITSHLDSCMNGRKNIFIINYCIAILSYALIATGNKSLKFLVYKRIFSQLEQVNVNRKKLCIFRRIILWICSIQYKILSHKYDKIEMNEKNQ